MLDFRINTFLAVCQTMNYTEAAKMLHITQPAVSQHIHYLEQQYGSKFFQYEGKHLSLTESGQLFLQTATTIQHDIKHLQEQISTLSTYQYLNFGATLTIGEYIMPESILHVLKHEPNIQIRMVVENTDELLKLLNQGKIDFAIIEGFFPRHAYESLTYKEERFLPVCACDYTFAKPVFRLEDLLSEQLLVRENGSGTREALERSLMEHNMVIKDFNKLTELGNLNAIKSLVSAGAGISFFYESAVKEELKSGLLREIPLEDFYAKHDFTFLWQKGSVFSPYYRRVFELLNGEC